MEDAENYERVVKKFGPVKETITALAKQRKIEEIIELWNKIRAEARFLVRYEKDTIEKELLYYEYVGSTLQLEFARIINSLMLYDDRQKIFNSLSKS
jgi:hypothetical protein